MEDLLLDTMFNSLRAPMQTIAVQMELLARDTLVRGQYVAADGCTDKDLEQMYIYPIPAYLWELKNKADLWQNMAPRCPSQKIKKKRKRIMQAYVRELKVLKRQVYLAEQFRHDFKFIKDHKRGMYLQIAGTVEFMLGYCCPTVKRVLQIADEGTMWLRAP